MANPTVNDGSLEKRVLQFLETRDGAECIDKLVLTPQQRNGEKADFLLINRCVVCEVKSLQSDTKEKIDKLLRPIIDSEQAPVFYGSWEVSKILKHFPNGEEIRREVFDTATSAIQTLFRKANRQIRTTKQLFNLPKAGGLLVIANDLVEILSPEVLSHKIGELFRKKHPSGELQFPEVQAVWVLSETHFAEIGHGMKALPIMLLARDGPCEATDLLEKLQPEWAAANGIPLVHMNQSVWDTVQFQSAKEKKAKDGSLPVHEIWRRNYRQAPYLRRHSEVELAEYFKKLMAGLTPGFLKVANDEQQKQSHFLMEKFTHFLVEVEERGLDMKMFGSDMRELGDLIRSGNIPTVNIGDIAPLSEKEASLVVGQYYTNSYKKNFRCLKIEGDMATLVLFDVLMGKSLEAVIGVLRLNWKYYWPLLDEQLIAALDKRYERFSKNHPQ